MQGIIRAVAQSLELLGGGSPAEGEENAGADGAWGAPEDPRSSAWADGGSSAADGSAAGLADGGGRGGQGPGAAFDLAAAFRDLSSVFDAKFADFSSMRAAM